MPEWLITLLSGAAGAFVAAWLGAQLGFRRNKKERALDRRIVWHEEAIQALAKYEEKLERLRRHALHVLVIQRGREQSASSESQDVPNLIQAPEELWTD